MQDFSTVDTRVLPVVGLTGGIGSGKSTFARILQSFGVPVFNADEHAKALYASDEGLRHWIATEIGAECTVWESDRPIQVDHQNLARVIFNDHHKLQALNAQVHPRVAEQFNRWHERMDTYRHPAYVVREAAILFESGSNQNCTFTIAIQAATALRVKRASARSGAPESAIRERMNHQWTDDQRAQAADFIVFNDEHHELLSQALSTHQAILERLQESSAFRA